MDSIEYKEDEQRNKQTDYIKERFEANDIDYIRHMVNKHPNILYRSGVKIKDRELILDLAKGMQSSMFSWRLFRVVDESVIDESFIRQYIDIGVNKGFKLETIVAGINNVLIPLDAGQEKDKMFWNIVVYDDSEYSVFYSNLASLQEKRREQRLKIKEQRKRSLRDGIENKSIEAVIKLTSSDERNNPEFMLELISKNPNLYVCSSERLKEDQEFLKLVKEKVPEAEPIIVEDEKRREEEKARIQEEETRKKLERKRRRQDIKEQEQRERENAIIQEYIEKGEQHPNLKLVNKYLAANISRTSFCQQFNISGEQLDSAIKEVSMVYPEIGIQIEERNRRAAAIHLQSVRDITNKLLSGEMTVKEYTSENYRGKKIKDLLNICDETSRKRLHLIVLNSINSGMLTMIDYMKLFSDKSDYATIIDSINKYFRMLSKEMPELQGRGNPINRANQRIKSLSKYSKPYKNDDFIGTSRGFPNANGQVVMTTITEQHVEYAKKYLKLQGEYICYATMNSAISTIVSGKVTFDDIDRSSKPISMKSVVANAINSGITLDNVLNADRSANPAIDNNMDITE